MRKRPDRLTVEFLATAPNGVHRDPGDLKGVALEIKVSNSGKTKVGYNRFNGTPFGENRVARLRIGRYDDLGLPGLRRARVTCEDLIRHGKSPRKHFREHQELKRAGDMTLNEALDAFWIHAIKTRLWSAPVQVSNTRTRRKHLPATLPVIGMRLADIRAKHLDDDLHEKWTTTSGTGRRLRSLIHSAIQLQIDDEDSPFNGPNPASWRQKSKLSGMLGKPLPYTPRPGVHFEDVPKVVAYFCGPMDHWVPGYLTVQQAAYAWERKAKTIGSDVCRGAFTGIIESPARFASVPSNLIPLSELKRQYGEPKHTPQPMPRENAALYAAVLRALILAPVRAANICNLRWRNIIPASGDDMATITYLPERFDRATGQWLPSEHKNGRQFNTPYMIPLTDNLNAIIEEQRRRQIASGIAITPDGFVFQHGNTRSGVPAWSGKPANHAATDDYLHKAIKWLNADGANIRVMVNSMVVDRQATVHGFRGASFITWAAKRPQFSNNMIDLMLGHVVSAVMQTSSNRHYWHSVQLIPERHEMMKQWEQHCLSLVEPLATNVVALFR
jgi:integrase